MSKKYVLSKESNLLIDAKALENKNNLKEDIIMSNENKKVKVYSNNIPSLPRIPESEKVIREREAYIKKLQALRAKKPAQPKPAQLPIEEPVVLAPKFNQPIDHTFINPKTGNRCGSIKSVITALVDKDHNFIGDRPWLWKTFTYKQICAGYYGKLKVNTNQGYKTISELVDTLRVLERRGNWEHFHALKDKIDTYLDFYSNTRKWSIQQDYYKYKRALEHNVPYTGLEGGRMYYPLSVSENSINRSLSLLEADGIDLDVQAPKYVMHYNLADNGETYYNGKPSDTGPIKTYYREDIGKIGTYYENHVVATNSMPKLEGSSTSDTPKLHYYESSVKAMLELGKVFDVEPHFQWDFKHEDQRIFGVTDTKYEEFKYTVTWYLTEAENGNDMSPEVTLHHPDGVHTLTITKYERWKNSEKYEEWYETELRDFQYESSGNTDEYEDQADILDN